MVDKGDVGEIGKDSSMEALVMTTTWLFCPYFSKVSSLCVPGHRKNTFFGDFSGFHISSDPTFARWGKWCNVNDHKIIFKWR